MLTGQAKIVHLTVQRLLDCMNDGKLWYHASGLALATLHHD